MKITRRQLRQIIRENLLEVSDPLDQDSDDDGLLDSEEEEVESEISQDHLEKINMLALSLAPEQRDQADHLAETLGLGENYSLNLLFNNNVPDEAQYLDSESLNLLYTIKNKDVVMGSSVTGLSLSYASGEKQGFTVMHGWQKDAMVSKIALKDSNAQYDALEKQDKDDTDERWAAEDVVMNMILEVVNTVEGRDAWFESGLTQVMYNQYKDKLKGQLAAYDEDEQ
jgi:hypothetical protein